MIDHLLKFTSEAEAIQALPAHRGGVDWRMDYCIPGAAIYSVAADGKKMADGSWCIWVALPTKDATLVSLPNCVLVTDRDAAAQNKSFITVTTLDQATLSALFFQPVNAGTTYLKTVGKQDILKDTATETAAPAADQDLKI